MKGKIRPTSRHRYCPVCGEEFDFAEPVGFLCVKCLPTMVGEGVPRPKRFHVDVWYRGKRISVCSDKTGQALDTYERARKLQAYIEVEIDNHTFDPSTYVKSEQAKYFFAAFAAV